MSLKKKMEQMLATLREQETGDLVVVGQLNEADHTLLQRVIELYEKGSTLSTVISDLTDDLGRLTEVVRRAEFRLSENLRSRLGVPDDAAEPDFAVMDSGEVCLPRTQAVRLGLGFKEGCE
jgi:hypothetical protein